MPDRTPPAGTVTFLFTDIESSTWLLQHLGDDYDRVLHDHHRLLRDAWEANDGYEVSTEGDAFFVTFDDPAKAVRAALQAQLALARHPWPEGGAVRVRIGIHTGEARVYDGDYVGLAVHQAARISSAAHGGQVLTSESSRADCGGVSYRDLGPHRLKDLAQPVRLFQLVHPDLGSDFPPPRTLTVAPNNFPLQTTSFVGRDRDLAEVRDLLASSRLVTLTGAGGIGKTRLALQAAAEGIDDFADGAWLVDLAPLSDPDGVVGAAADAVGVREQTGRPLLDTLTDSLLPRRLLLVLDNCEHLIDACAKLVHQLLTTCPGVKVLATSRESLNVAGESAWRVPSLSLPSELDAGVSSLAHVESVRLFVQRGRAVRAGFDLSDANAEHIAQICRRLDGLPLAIELAAARVGAMAPAEIAERLDDRFRLLTGGSRLALPRQRTLEAAVSWSYELLSEPERLLFERMSVFAGGCDADAAQRVCSDEQLDTFEVIDLLAQLVDRSLVVADEDPQGRTRYRMLETIRQFGRERLIEHGDAAAVRDRHLAWAVTVAERPTGAYDRLAWVDDPEQDNLYVAVEWATENGDVTSALRILTSAWLGHFGVRSRWFDRLLPLAADVDPALLAVTYRTAGGLDFMTGRWAQGAQRMRLGAEAYAQVGDDVGRAWCRVYEAICVGGAGDEPGSRAMLETLVDDVRRLEDTGPLARTLLALTWQETEHDLGAAERLALEGERVSLGLEAPFDRAHAWEVLGYVRCLQGRFDEAAVLIAWSLQALVEAKIPTCGAHALETGAALAAMTGRYELGAELQGTADAIRTMTGDAPRPWEVVVREKWLPLIAQNLDASTFEAARRRGAQRTFEEAVAYAGETLGAGAGT